MRVPTPNEAQKFAKIAFTETEPEFTVDETGDSLAALQKELLASDDHEPEVKEKGFSPKIMSNLKTFYVYT